ncbi:MAG TPA: BBE domain-containing protein, partial [Pirellulales bacterium]
LTGFPSETPAEIPATTPRVFAFKKSPFVNSLDARAAAGLIDAIRTAPTPLCRIDFQQCGGALSDVSPTATAFWNRDFQWSCPIIGGYTDVGKERETSMTWARQTAHLLAPYTLGTYSVEITPGLPETASEVKQAFGENLARLGALKRKWDPENLFRLYYPI